MNLSLKLKNLWLRWLDLGCGDSVNAEDAKKIRLLNAYRASIFLFSMALVLANYKNGATLLTIYNSIVATLCVAFTPLIRAGKWKRARAILIFTAFTGPVFTHFLYGDQVVAYMTTFPIIGLIVTLYNAKDRMSVWGPMVFVIALIATIKFGREIFTPLKYPAAANFYTQLMINSMLVIWFFRWYQKENAKAEDSLRQDKINLQNANNELIEARRQLELQTSRLLQKTKMTTLAEMSTSMAHEINNPLTITMGNLAVIKAENGKPHPDSLKIAKYLEIAFSHSERIAKVVSSLLRNSFDWDQVERTSINVQSAIQDTLLLTTADAFRHNVLMSGPADLTPVMAFATPSHLVQILYSVIVNAIDAAQGQKDAWVKIAIQEHFDCVNIIVSGTIPDGKAVAIHGQIAPENNDFFHASHAKGFGLKGAKELLTSINGDLVLDASGDVTNYVIKLPKSKQNAA